MQPRVLKAIVIAIGAGIFALFLLLPKQPRSIREEGGQQFKSPEVAKALALIEAGETPMEGILMLRDFADKNPENAEAQYYLGKLSIQSGQFEKAVERFEQVVEMDSEWADAWMELGGLHLSLGNAQRSLECAREVRALNPEEVNALFLEAASLESLGSTDDALLVYEELEQRTDSEKLLQAVRDAITRLKNS